MLLDSGTAVEQVAEGMEGAQRKWKMEATEKVHSYKMEEVGLHLRGKAKLRGETARKIVGRTKR
jgi:hypothetical protein